MDRIDIKGLEVFAYHGVLPEERREGQNFYIDATLYLDMSKAGKSDNLDDTVNYAKVCEEISIVFKKKEYNLIEKAAWQTVKHLLKIMPKIRKIDMTVNKPSAPIGLPFDNVSVSISREWTKVILSIGSNMGDKDDYLNYAVESLYNEPCCRVNSVSKYIETQPYGYLEQDNFLNGCVEIETIFTPHELLDFIQKVEYETGRKRTVHWGPRTLDIDIIFFGDKIINDKRLTVPHKEMHKRAFVLVPLAQIAPYEIHPISRKSVQQMLDEMTNDDMKTTGIERCSGCSGCRAIK